MKKQLLLFIPVILIISCSHSHTDDIFNGEVILIEKSGVIDSLKAERLDLDGIYTGYISVYDSLLLFISSKFPDHYLSIFNANTGEHLGSYCKKGEGPDEFLYFTHNEQYVLDNGRLKIWGYNDVNKNYFIDITRSIQEQKTCIAQEIKQNWKKKHTRAWAVCFTYGDSLLIKSQPQSLLIDKDIPSLATYSFYNQSADSLLRKYELYTKMPDGTSPFLIDNLFYSSDKISLDNTKVAMAMFLLAQINILDLETGVLKGYRLKDSPDFNRFSNEYYTPSAYYTDICVSRDRMYALYANLEINGINQFPFETKEIHVFNWEGTMLKRIILEHKTGNIAIDNVNNYLYAINEQDEVFRYKLKDI